MKPVRLWPRSIIKFSITRGIDTFGELPKNRLSGLLIDQRKKRPILVDLNANCVKQRDTVLFLSGITEDSQLEVRQQVVKM